MKDILLLAIDDHALPWRKNLYLTIAKPAVHPGPVLAPSRDDPAAPDHLAAHFYGTVLHDERRYRMWYYAVGLAEGGDTSLEHMIQGPMCYAESEDGIHWIKPNLGRVRYKGSCDNNIIDLPEAHLADPRIEGVMLIKDGEDPDPARRYKLLYNYHPKDRPFFTVRTATSADGIDWAPGPPLPIDEFVEHASVYRYDGLYYLHAQSMSPHHLSDGGHARGRQGYVWVSPDFDHWLEESAEAFLLPEPADPPMRGTAKPYDQVHLGVGAADVGGVLVGLYCCWHNRPIEGDWFGRARTSGDFGLLLSNDGVHFREPVKGHVFLSGQDSPVTPVPGTFYPTILCQANGILNVGDETRIYHGRWRNAGYGHDYYGEVALAVLPRDRWGSLRLNPGQTEGAAWSAPVVLPPEPQIALNADAAGGMRVEVSDERFGLLPGWSGEDSGRPRGGAGLYCPVSWAGRDLGALSGKRVRLRVRMRGSEGVDPCLYAMYVRSGRHA
ncbi:MAG: hypothetical protein JXA09_12400 [Anaerolineae bacterium]|nr:hypothetical protein [Anaerolineae bacterium]